ncbi:TraB/VirB10 family protein [Rhodanobacter sp. FW106-PBR-LB-2-11]|uniref:TraB/VirB10 family protein n=1 Tax=Rhodanobacter sp. FW106-PBR-LB-2-11 TaxID=1524463 RepID=UPI0034E4E17C
MATNKPTNKMSLKERWDAMSPGSRRKATTVGVLGVVLLLAWLALGGSGNKKVTNDADAKAQIANALLPSGDARDLGVNGISDQVTQLQNDKKQQDQQIAQLKQELLQSRQEGMGDASQGTQQKMATDLDTLHREVEAMRQQMAQHPGPGGVAGQNSGQGISQRGAPVPQQPATHSSTIREIQSETQPPPHDTSTNPEPSGTKVATQYLPSGSMLTGVNITGVDAATGQAAMQNPIPMLVRIKHDAVLPNRYRADVRECFVLASGYGDLASERAYMRASSISCIRTDHRVIDIKVEMVAIGPDGKAGIRGRLVSRQGEVIAKAALAGLAQGTAQAFGGGQNQMSYLQPGTLPSAGTAGAEALGGGVGSAFNEIAKYYLKLADQMFPVIEIDPGQRISFVLEHGANMGVLR